MKYFVLLAAMTSAAQSQSYTISTVAGGGPLTGQAAITYGLNAPTGVAVDGAGNIYVAIPNWCQVWVVSASGVLMQVIGNGACGFSGDSGPASSAELFFPNGVAVDSSGTNIYIADSWNNRIRKVSGGIITTVAGNGTADFNGDNIAATSAALNSPSGVAVDGSGNLYIADIFNARIRKVSGGIITTVAGNGTWGYNGDNIAALSAELDGPNGVAVDSSGNNIYITEL
ncbi:MAG TPA: hypothetical protein VGL72_33640, partial [Bryobacteraceae bacterium]